MIASIGQMVRFAVFVNVVVFVMAAAAPSAATRPIRLVAFGDSLTAGYGLRQQDAFPVRLEQMLKARGHAVDVINAGVSGDTTAGGRERIDWAVPAGTDAVILELGANDALRGLPVDRARANLDAILTQLKQRGIVVLVAGMRAPRNLGDAYANAFDAMFAQLAEKHDALLYPFFLAGVALDPKLNLSDGIHPNAAGVQIITERILDKVEELLARVKAKGPRVQ
jgi:acyl-CoA thioesterase I